MIDPWHSLTGDEAMSQLGTGREGLSEADARGRLETHGPNELVAEGGRSPLVMFLQQFNDTLIWVLIAAAVISAAIGFFEGEDGGYIDALVIMIIVVVNAIFGFVQEYRAEKTLEALKEMASPKVTIIRDGVESEIPSKDLVPGDMMILETGDRVPADGRLIEAVNLKVNESTLTGESVPMTKDAGETFPEGTFLGERANMVFSGCLVEYGRGSAVVTSTGMETALGQIAKLVQTEKEETPLQRKLDRLGRQLGVAVLGIVVVIMAVGLFEGADIITMFMTAVSLAVAAIPEGLPAVVTISLALGLQRMVKRNALMRRLPAVESLGSATVICSDKTGTLTKGEMNIREIDIGYKVSVSGEGFEPVGEFTRDGEPYDPADAHMELLLRAGALCNDARLSRDEDRWSIRGDSTEGTIIVTARKAGMDENVLKERYPRTWEIPFDSVKKRMTTVHEHDGGRIVFMKGATESVLRFCTSIMTPNGAVPMTDTAIADVKERSGDMCGRALRVLGIAYKESYNGHLNETDVESGLTFLGLVGMIDAPRKEAIEAVASAKHAGITVKMITGDHPLTAGAIATEMGIVESGSRVMTGAELDALSRSELSNIVNEVSVYARVSPENKVQIVDALKTNGEVVAMTGDGANDAPALKRADIGVAMGITGTDVSKEAAEMILTDDNFASIVDAIEEGRGIYSNIKKFVGFLLSCNAGEVATMFMATLIFAGPEFLPFLLPIQLLWMNLVTDGLPALALGIEPTDHDVMHMPPRDPNESPVDRMMSYRIVAIGLWMAVCTLLAFWIEYEATDDIVHARTVAFCTIVMFQLLYVFSMRSQRKTILEIGVRSNMYVLYAVLISVLLQLAVVYLPGVNGVFGTVAIGASEWALVLVLAVSGLVINEAYKAIAFRKG